MSALLGPLGAALVIVVAAVWLAGRERDSLSPTLRRILGGLVLVAGVVAGVVAWQSAGEATALASSTVTQGQSLHVMSTGRPLAVLAEVPDAGEDAAAGAYTLRVRDGETVVQREVVRFGAEPTPEGGPSPFADHGSERRLLLDAVAAGHPLHVDLLQTSDPESPPLRLSVVPAPAPIRLISGLGLLLAAAAALVEAVARQRSHQGGLVLGLTLFALLIADDVTPHAPLVRVVLAALIAFPIGLLGGVLLKSSAAWVVRTFESRRLPLPA